MSGSLENLSSNGIINFDADAYVKSGIGKPAHEEEAYLPLDKPLLATPQIYGVYPGPHLSGHPDVDAFITHRKEPFHPTWKQILAGIGGTAIATVGIAKLAIWHKAREAAKKAKAAKLAKQAKIIKGFKIAGGILLGLGAIYGVYKYITNRQNKESEGTDDKTKKNHFPKLFQPKDKEKVETPETPETPDILEQPENKEKNTPKPKPIQHFEH